MQFEVNKAIFGWLDHFFQSYAVCICCIPSDLTDWDLALIQEASFEFSYW
jgi:hypothetical protein